MTHIPWRPVLVAAVFISAANALTGAVIGTFASWPGTWTPGERGFAWGMLLDLSAGWLIGRALARGRADS